MKQKQIYLLVGVVSLTLLTVFVVNHFKKTPSKPDNPFLTIDSTQKNEVDSSRSGFNPDDIYTPVHALAKYKGSKVLFKEIPLSTQFDIYRIKQNSYMQIIILLKEMFIIRDVYESNGRDLPPILPPITKVLSVNSATRAEAEQLWEKMKDQYPIKDKQTAILNILQDIQVRRHTDSFLKEIRKMEREKVYKLGLVPPKVPSFDFLNPKKIPTLGNKNSKNQLLILTQYGCKNCMAWNLQISDVFKEIKEGLVLKQVLLSPKPSEQHGPSVESQMGGFMSCALKQDSNAYWKIHVDFIRNKNLLSKMSKSFEEHKVAVVDIFKKHLKDMEKWQKCIADDENNQNYRALVESVVQFLGVQSVPVIYLNGRYLDVSAAGLASSIKEALANPLW